MIIGTPAGQKSEMDSVRMHSALRSRTLNDLLEIRKRRWDNDIVKRDIKAFLMILEVRKNILLFFPYEYYFKDDHSFKEGITYIPNVLKADFGRAMEYRTHVVSDLDIYFSFIYENQLVILSGKDFKVLDCVSLEKSPAYARMSWGYDIFGE